MKRQLDMERIKQVRFSNEIDIIYYNIPTKKKFCDHIRNFFNHVFDINIDMDTFVLTCHILPLTF